MASMIVLSDSCRVTEPVSYLVLFWLVVSIPLKNIYKSSVGVITIPNIWGKHVPNHQSDISLTIMNHY